MPERKNTGGAGGGHVLKKVRRVHLVGIGGSGMSGIAEVLPFLHDMERRLAQADLVLCRAGATTCAELTVAGRASVLVPFAAAADDHQRKNAQALQQAGAAVMVEEKDLGGESLARAITGVLADPGRLAAMEDAARGLGRPDAAARVADLLEGKGA